MARTILVAGTASHVGKSTVAAGLCRYLADRGVSVAPFKGQNMSNNARVVVRPDADSESSSIDDAGSDENVDTASKANADVASDCGSNDDSSFQWGEIGVSQFVQARAAEVTPSADMNPVLLKPRGDGESQLVVQGRPLEHLSAGEYYENHWERAREAARESHRRLAADHDVIVAEGAGSIAEINLADRDLANIETARFADADILLVVDIERGGAFASLYGTVELLPTDVRERIAGAIITKFRGEESLLKPGIDEIEARTGVPILGVIPYDDPGLPEEDSVALPATGERGTIGPEAEREESELRIAVPRFPHLSNAADLETLAAHPAVTVECLPVDSEARSLERADAVVLPGTKNTVDDLRSLRRAGYDDRIGSFDGPIVGICGGYQMLGERITNASCEGTGERETIEGFGLLPVETSFSGEKRLEQSTVRVDGSASPLLAGASGTASGYEIHAGETTALEPVGRPLGETSAAQENVLGTYLHGLFDNKTIRTAFLESVADAVGRERNGIDRTLESETGSVYDRAGSLVAENVNLATLGDPFS